jgi:predicted GIY-YIG superfamily endonuclease
MVYVHLDSDGKIIYYGITNNFQKRAKKHRRDKRKRGVLMVPITDYLDPQIAKTIEGKLIRIRWVHVNRSKGIDQTNPIIDQLKEADLDNRNRGSSRENGNWERITIRDYLENFSDGIDIQTPKK